MGMMGTPDSIYDLNRDVYFQVKCWDCTMADYKVGDKVPDIGYHRTYTIALLEPDDGVHQYFANVKNGILHSITDFPIDALVFDKWGGNCDPKKPYGPIMKYVAK